MFRAFRFTSPTPGSAPTYLLLHGVGLSHRFYSGLAKQLARSARVVSFDLPGFGVSPTPSQALTVAQYAAGVAARLPQLAPGAVIVVGHSMGAQVAVELAIQRPELVEGVVLIGPVVDSDRPTLTEQARALARDSPLEPLPTQYAVIFDYIRCGIPWFLSASKAMRDYPMQLSVQRLSQPLLIIRGQHDPVAKAAWCQRLAAQAAGAVVRTVPRRRHNVAHSDPSATASAITEFADRTRA